MCVYMYIYIYICIYIYIYIHIYIYIYIHTPHAHPGPGVLDASLPRARFGTRGTSVCKPGLKSTRLRLEQSTTIMSQRPTLTSGGRAENRLIGRTMLADE